MVLESKISKSYSDSIVFPVFVYISVEIKDPSITNEASYYYYSYNKPVLFIKLGDLLTSFVPTFVYTT